MLLLLNISAVQTPNDSRGSYETLGYFFSGPSLQHSPGYHSRIIRNKNVQPT